MKKYRVSEELKPYIRRILTRGFQPFKFKKEGEQTWCLTPISSNAFHLIAQRAKCEKQSRIDGCFYVTSKEVNKPYLLQALLSQANVNSYTVIDDRDGTRRHGRNAESDESISK